ncbi:MAG: glycerate kinase type-2 family protein [Candidatus Binatia bacterium]
MANIKESRPGKQGPWNFAKRRARQSLQKIYQAAVSAAQPSVLLKKRLKISASVLVIETGRSRSRFPLTGKVYVVAVGKGADVSARFWPRLLGDRLEQGIFIVRDRIVRERFQRIAILPAGHPLPDYRGLSATKRCLEMLGRAGRNDCVIVFLMGGASSLLVQPASGIPLKDKRAATALFLKSGMNIREMNCVRKHISAVKAGGLLRAAYPARVLTLAISDVIGDDPEVIGSGPSFHDSTTFSGAWKILQKHGLASKIPRAVKNHLLRGIRGEIPETLKPGSLLSGRSPYTVIANNQDSLLAAKKKAESLGFSARVLTAELSGDARLQARAICRKLKSSLRKKQSLRRPVCFLLGGETTVSVKGKGLGGRNQEFALASALELRGYPGISLLSAASDGSDGPTDAAGAFVDGDTLARARRIGLDPYRALRDNDSYHFFEPLGDLFRPGPTGTNVLDFVIALVY